MVDLRVDFVIPIDDPYQMCQARLADIGQRAHTAVYLGDLWCVAPVSQTRRPDLGTRLQLQIR